MEDETDDAQLEHARKRSAPALRSLLEDVVNELMNEDGEPWLMAVEPDREPGQYTSHTGASFDLAPAISPDLWARLIDIYDEPLGTDADW
jgi:hypothetical protein